MGVRIGTFFLACWAFGMSGTLAAQVPEYGVHPEVLPGDNAFNSGDFAIAEVEYARACDADIGQGCQRLARFYDTEGVELRGGPAAGAQADLVRSIELFRRACDTLDNDVACALLALKFRDGLGVEANQTEANARFEKACALGHPYGCENLPAHKLESGDFTLGLARLAETQKITQRAISDDGSLVAIGTDGGILSVYEGYSGDLLSSDKLADNPIEALLFSPTGRHIYVQGQSEDQFGVRYSLIWDLVESKLAWRGRDPISDFQFSKNGGYFGGKQSGRFFIWEYAVKNGLRYDFNSVFFPRTQSHGAWAFSPDETSVALELRSGFMIWNLGSRSTMATISDRFCCGDIEYSPDGSIIAGSSDLLGGARRLTFWDARSGRVLRRTELEAGQNLAFSSDGQKLLMSSDLGESGNAKIYDVRTGGLLLAVDRHPSTRISFPQRFVLNDQFLVDAPRLYGINPRLGGLWDAQTGAPIEKTSALTSIHLSQNGQRLIAATVEGTGIVIGDTVSTLKLDRQMSASELAQARQDARRRTNAILSERQAEIDERARAQELGERIRREQEGSNQSILGAILQGASNSLTEYNQREYAKRQEAQRRADLNRRLTHGTGSNSSSGTGGGEITLEVTYDGPVEQAAPETDSFVRVLPPAPPPRPSAPPPCNAPEGASCVTPET